MFYLHNGTYTVESKIFSTKLDELPFVYRLEKASYILFYSHNGTYTVKSKIILRNCPSYIHQKKRHISFENQYFSKIQNTNDPGGGK